MLEKNEKLIKHKPPAAFKFQDNESQFRLKSSALFMSSVKQIEKKLARIEKDILVSKTRNYGSNIQKNKFIYVVGLQKTIQKLLNIALYFQQKQHKVELTTFSVKALDEVEKETEESEYSIRTISGMKAKIYISSYAL